MAPGLTIVKVGAFFAFVRIGGTRILSRLFDRAVATGSRELFTLALVAAAIGVAFAGMVVNGSDHSEREARELQPLRDVFTVLFFVSATPAQIGEFSFILVAPGLGLGLLSLAGQGLILAGTIVSITLDPLVFRHADVIQRRQT